MLDKARPFAQPYLEKVAKPFLKVHPNWITLIGFLFGVAFFCAMRRGFTEIALVLLLGVAVDSLDGTVARLSGKESKFGAFFDSTLDRFTDVLMIAAFAVAGFVSWPLVMASAVMSLMVSYTRGTAEKLMENKVKLAVGIMERPERLLLIAVATFIAAFTPDASVADLKVIEALFWLLLILSTVTMGQRMWKAYQLLS
jgi:archaetidylinositol phosphate synthase